ncbi:hypothetical protein FRC12_013998 [Ceratobasidium sp. 428]|nr:hypothetical protein FRC12_013998 [Ceratobasidium sp. 428]
MGMRYFGNGVGHHDPAPPSENLETEEDGAEIDGEVVELPQEDDEPTGSASEDEEDSQVESESESDSDLDELSEEGAFDV